jgi:ankyrin repeat protein
LIEAHAVELNEEPQCLDREGRSYEPDDLVDICLGLIEIFETGPGEVDGPGVFEIDERSPLVRIAHFSVKEYLQSDRIRQQKAERFAIDNESANTELSQICLVYLLDPTLSDGILDRGKLNVFALAEFAAENWFHYYQSSQGNPKTEKLLLRLFQNDNNAFMTWVRLYMIDDPRTSFFDFQRPVNGVLSPIYYASFLGLEVILRTLLAIHVETGGLKDIINTQFGYYAYALQAAASEGHKRVVQILLDHSADINAQGGRFDSALEAASFGGHKDVVQLLLDLGADVNGQKGFSYALFEASRYGHNQVVQILLDHGASVNAKKGFSYALFEASHRGHNQVVQILLDHGANMNVQGISRSALIEASMNGHGQVVQILLDHGADVNAQGRFYGTALIAASVRGHDNVVQILLDHGADVHVRGEHGNALLAASRWGHDKVVQLLLDHGACVNVWGKHGHPLHTASRRGYGKVVRTLLDHGADVNAKGGIDDRFNAIQVALVKGYREIVLMLLDKGANVTPEDAIFIHKLNL